MKYSLRLLLFLLSGLVYADGNTVLDVIPLQNRPASELQPLLSPLLENTDHVIDNGSSLIVKTTPARLESIKNLVKKLDAKINNLIVTVIQNSSKSAEELNAEAAALIVSPTVIQMQGMVTDTRDVASSRSTQTLRTLDGQPAYIKTGKIKPIQNVSIFGGVSGNQLVGNNQVAGSNTQFIEADSGFAVIPRLNGHTVMLDIEPRSEHFQQEYREIQSARTTLRANLGEWVEIAGNNAADNQSDTGMNTFNHSTVETNQANLRILIKVDKAD